MHHLTDGWERHYNADRLQVTASTFKVPALVVYAQAVADGRLDPERTVTKTWTMRDDGRLLVAVKINPRNDSARTFKRVFDRVADDAPPPALEVSDVDS